MASKKTKAALAATLDTMKSTALTLICYPEASVTGAKPKSFVIKVLKGIQYQPEFLAFVKSVDNTIYAKGLKYISTANGTVKIANGILTDTMKTTEWFLRNASTLLLTAEQRLMGEAIQDRNFSEVCGKLYNADVTKVTVEEAHSKEMSKTLRQVKTYTREVAKAETAKTPLAGLRDSLAKHPASIAYIAQKESIKLLAQAAKKATLALPVSQA